MGDEEEEEGRSLEACTVASFYILSWNNVALSAHNLCQFYLFNDKHDDFTQGCWSHHACSLAPGVIGRSASSSGARVVARVARVVSTATWPRVDRRPARIVRR